MAKIKNGDDKNAGKKNIEQMIHSSVSGMNAKWYGHIEKLAFSNFKSIIK